MGPKVLLGDKAGWIHTHTQVSSINGLEQKKIQAAFNSYFGFGHAESETVWERTERGEKAHL